MDFINIFQIHVHVVHPPLVSDFSSLLSSIPIVSIMGTYPNMAALRCNEINNMLAYHQYNVTHNRKVTPSEDLDAHHTIELMSRLVIG